MSGCVPPGYTIDARAHYAREHLWVRLENDLAVLGVSDLRRAQVGGGHVVDVKPVGAILRRGEELAGWDAEKAILSLSAPIGGAIVEVNEQIAARPDLGCIDPYGARWIAKLAPSDWEAERVYLLDVKEYLALYAKTGAP